MSVTTEQLLATEYERAGQFYSRVEPGYIGKAMLGVSAADGVVDISELYALADAAIQRDPIRAHEWARHFGALNVALSLKSDASSFGFIAADTHVDRSAEAEVATCPLYRLGDVLCASEADGPITYLLVSADQPTRAEIAVVQALHMVDTAIVTGQYPGARPLVRTVSLEQLLELKRRDPELFIRTYGNVRKAGDVPVALGAVVATAALERSGVTTTRLAGRSAGVRPRPTEIDGRRQDTERVAYVGITTAKMPHLGHGFLLARAMSLQPTILLELNDNGPRVDQAIARIAQLRGISLTAAAGLVTAGEVSMLDLQVAYRGREQAPTSSEAVPRYSLTAANAYYRQLLRIVAPPNRTIVTVSNSEQDSYRRALTQNPAYRALFGGSGMSVVRSAHGQAVVVEQAGAPTVAGIIAAIATRYALDVCDSPRPVSQAAGRILSEATGAEIRQFAGCGILVDFEECSGTKGNVILLEDLVKRITRTGFNPNILFPTIRRMLDVTPGLRSETGSICPNFASYDAVLQAFDRALGDVAAMGDPFALLNSSVRQRGILGLSLQELTLDPQGDGQLRSGKMTVAEGRLLLNAIPVLSHKFSASLVRYLTNAEDQSLKIPLSVSTERDRTIIQMLRSGNPERVLPLVIEQIKTDAGFADRIFTETRLGRTIQAMGYRREQLDYVLAKLLEAGEVFTYVATK